MEIIRGIIITFFILISALFFTKDSLQCKRWVQCGVVAAIILIITFRPATMADYMNYVDAFAYGDEMRFEPAFLLIANVTGIVRGGYLLGFFLFACITVSVRFRYVSEYKPFFFAAVLVYLSNVMIIQDMVAIRAAGAGAFLFPAVYYKVSGNIKLSFISVLIAVLFHYTAISFFILFLMDNVKPRRWVYLGVLAISYVLASQGYYITRYIDKVSFISVYFTLYDSYVAEMEFQQEPMNIFNLLQLGHLLICVVFWLNINKLKKISKSVLLFLKLYTIGVCCVCWFAHSFPMAIRFSELFLVVEIILIPMGFYSLFNNKMAYKIVLITYALIIFSIRMSDYMYWNQALL